MFKTIVIEEANEMASWSLITAGTLGIYDKRVNVVECSADGLGVYGRNWRPLQEAAE